MTILNRCRNAACAVSLVTLAVACGGSDDDKEPAIPANITLVPASSNVVSYWTDIGAATVNATAAVATTPEEARPTFHTDLATMHLAIYDAVSAIDGRYKPFAITPATPAAGASMDAAASAAAYGVLSALFPNRSAQYQAAYDSYIARIPAGDAKTRGLALGAEVAAGVVANRANDDRSVVLAPYVPGTAPGKFRGVNPVSRFVPFIRPFTLASISQFRPAPPPALDSTAYAADLNETKGLGGAVSSLRTAEQFEIARFHTEAPPIFLTRNFGRFARTTDKVADAARLMALIYVGYSDAINACFEAKYFYETWRPLSAVPLAETDNNPATSADPAWTPSLPTPNHPEYPAAHSCTTGTLGELLRLYFGTDKVTYTFDSTVTGTTRTYTTTGALAEESQLARIYGGMHFRYATTAGAELGKQVANWTFQRHFGRRVP
ncbi:vanadium-dependent haloperoxidase [Massilia niastensis]|uniref:vanadium-dependent haloperoxidase n=1 Tax=Massilia niastensis TaxID=544911 RepID=UPI0003623E28|nr:vanadium-dependent haloperoxidase [Massilia niastensis]